MSNLLSLTQLIHSLSKAEKRSFSQHTGLQQCGKSYLILYEIIRKGNSEDIEQEFQRLNPESDFTATVQYLWAILMKTLLSMRNEETDEEQILSGILEIKLLFRKGLVDEAFKLIIKYKKIARESEKFDYCLLLDKLELQHQNWHHFEGITDEDYLVKLQSRLRRDIQYELNLADHSTLYELLYYRYLQKGNVLSDKEKDHLNDLVVTEMNLSGNQRFESFDLNRNHLLFQSVYFMMTGDHRSSLRTYFELDKLFGANAHLWQDQPIVYINHIRGILNNLFNTRQVNEMDYFTDKLRILQQKTPRLIIDQVICVAELKKILTLGQFNKGIQMVEKEFAILFSHADSLATSDKAELHLFAALIYFHSNQYRKAAGLLRKIIYLAPTKNNWLWKMIKWLNLLVHIELNDFDYLLNETCSVERMLKKQANFYPSDKILLCYVKRYPLCMNKKAKILLAKGCLNDINALEKNIYEQQFLNTMNIPFWLAQKGLALVIFSLWIAEIQ
jgi:hypothetical protein